ncbi:MAG: ABC transporter ATP-binding protein [Acidobacteriota bacterium]|nr:ABC transporter ATP-binding protein [Acidobacteriota bacterium]MDP2391111.1 ABC transporter ATP-binding protein [Acidobacteriota bacterium]
MLLETYGLTKAFGGLRAVEGVDLAVAAGTITGIIGPNGAGKTTFFNLISGALPPTSGRIVFEGEDVTRLAAHQMARRGMARTFQATTLFADATAIENVLVGYRQRTRSGLWDALVRSRRLAREEREAHEAARATLELVGLGDRADRLANSLTQEQQKRLAMALALVAQPRLLLLDEPFAGINAEQSRGLIALIERIAAAGVTVCLIEHQMQAVMHLCQRIMVLDYGKKIAEGTPDEIRLAPAVLEAYLGHK